MRKCLEKEFSDIFIFNLRGNQYTQGEISRKEGGKIFGSGSRLPVAITLFVKDDSRKGCEIHYYSAGDYMTREEKLKLIESRVSFGEMMREGIITQLTPSDYGDWLNRRSETFEGFVRLGSKKNREKESIFEERYSSGLETGRDVWCCNFSRKALLRNIAKLNPDAIDPDAVRVSMYRPYTRMMLYFSRAINHRVFQMPHIFPEPDTKNLVICVSGMASKKDFSVMMTDCIPCYDMLEKTQCFPLYWYPYEEKGLFSSPNERLDGISDASLSEFISRYHDDTITKEAMFYYIYGVLSSPEYSSRFGNDTKRELARVPLADSREKFWAFSNAGRELGMLHVNYESVEEWPLKKIYTKGSDESGIVADKMRIVMLDGERVIRVNDGLTLSGIPGEAWRYIVNGRSALEWIAERYRDDTDKKTGIRNDCNMWGIEHGDEDYIVRLIAKVTRVSIESVRIIDGLPELGV